MRADAHYVDELDTPSIVKVQMIRVHAIDAGDEGNAAALPSLVDSIHKHGVIEPLIVQKRERRYRLIAGSKRLAAAKQAKLQEVPCLVRRIDDDEANLLAAAMKNAVPPAAPLSAPELRVVREPHGVHTAIGDVAASESRLPNLRLHDDAMAASLDVVLSSTALLSENGPQLARSVACDVIRAEARRAYAALQAARAMRYGVVADQRSVSPVALVQNVVEMLAPEAQLRRFAVRTAIDVGEGTMIRVNQDLLAHALFGVALMIAAPLARADSAALTVSASREPAGKITLSLVQRCVPVTPTWPSAPDVGDGPAIVSLVALRHAAQAYGGLVFTTRLPDGARVALEMPLATTAA